MNKPYAAPPLPDDIIRMIIMRATHSGTTVRVVCKAWLRISNSLTPFLINRMNIMNSMLQVALRKLAVAAINDNEEDEEMAACENVVAMRLMARTTKEQMGSMLAMFGVQHNVLDDGGDDDGDLAAALAEQLCNETDDEED